MAKTTGLPLAEARRRSAPRGALNQVNALIYLVLIVVGIISVIPFIWMLLTSIKDYGDVMSLRFWPWPPLGNSTPRFDNFAEAIRLIGVDRDTGLPMFFRHVLNTLLVTGIVVASSVATSVLAAYAFAQLQFPAKDVLFILVLATFMIPEELVLVPRAVMMNKNYLNWYNTIPAMVAPFLADAFGIFLIRQFFLQVPRELYDAARIDGAGHLRYLAMIMVPLAKPAIVTLALLEFIWTWNEFRWIQLVTASSNMRTVSVGLVGFLQTDGGSQTQLAMAVAVMVVLPIIILYLFTQRYFTEGITTTGLKG
ncbi:MAG: carbohydrate ABC transporter permease [Chloroflexi bacterium]|jgi:ABC-type glycerol-3-phosphate transport system permease component|nr:carbohydrate ABC transporter permease [Chloroflexota bacterium]